MKHQRHKQRTAIAREKGKRAGEKDTPRSSCVTTAGSKKSTSVGSGTTTSLLGSTPPLAKMSRWNLCDQGGMRCVCFHQAWPTRDVLSWHPHFVHVVHALRPSTGHAICLSCCMPRSKHNQRFQGLQTLTAPVHTIGAARTSNIVRPTVKAASETSKQSIQGGVTRWQRSQAKNLNTSRHAHTKVLTRRGTALCLWTPWEGEGSHAASRTTRDNATSV